MKKSVCSFCSAPLYIFLVVLSFVFSAQVLAEVKLASIFSDNMVLQQEMKVPVWGWGNPDEKILVKSDSGGKWKTKADSKGDWIVKIGPFETGKKLSLTIKGDNTITLTNILIGEVWICSGQSNMQWSVEEVFNSEKEIQNADYPNIRLFSIKRNVSGQPLNYCVGDWEVCSPQTIEEFSAVAYFFGRHLNTELDVPIGLINTSWGGTRIEPWTPVTGFKSVAKLKDIRNKIALADIEYTKTVADSLGTIEQWIKDARDAIKSNKDIPLLPKLPRHQLASHTKPTGLFNAMVNPIVPFGIRGVIWYQGESNRKDGLEYFAKMQALINGWRKVWDQGDFPFYIVQLAPFRYRGDNGQHYLPMIWEAQSNVLSLKNTGMAVTVDIGNLDDIHPKNKQDVGKRLALWALAKDYGKEDIVYSGPLYKSMSIEGNKIRISFDHTGAGLESRDGKTLTWFSIAGADKKFVDAVAEIDGDTVLVSSDSVTNPVAVRFGWSNLAEPNLSNKEGLPASPFRTDRW